MTNSPQRCSAESGGDHLRRIILGLFNPMPDGHPKGCLANENGPCQCGYAETAGKYLWALREAKKIAAEHYGQKEVEESRRMEEPAGLVEAAALVAAVAQSTGQWQSIETAPKDGTHILAFRVPIGIRFTSLTNPPTVVHWFDDPDQPGFYTSVNELAPEHPFNPTHWMPLPEAPR